MPRPEKIPLFVLELTIMKPRDEFIDYLLELMQPLGPVSARAMFGGHGIFVDDLMFAIVVDEVLYFKTCSSNLPEFEHRGLKPFTYQRRNRTYSMSYSEAPAEVLEDAETMRLWANGAIEAALNSRKTGTKA